MFQKQYPVLIKKDNNSNKKISSSPAWGTCLQRSGWCHHKGQRAEGNLDNKGHCRSGNVGLCKMRASCVSLSQQTEKLLSS